MKVRQGFVSNSSSSSFVIRGIKIEAKVLAEKLGIEKEDGDSFYESLEHQISDKIKGFDVYPTGNYFGAKNYETLVLGIDAGNLEDGEVTEFGDMSDVDAKVMAELGKYHIDVTDGLKLYIRYISNDNY